MAGIKQRQQQGRVGGLQKRNVDGRGGSISVVWDGGNLLRQASAAGGSRYATTVSPGPASRMQRQLDMKEMNNLRVLLRLCGIDPY